MRITEGTKRNMYDVASIVALDFDYMTSNVRNWGEAFSMLVEIGRQFGISVGIEYDSGYRSVIGSDGKWSKPGKDKSKEGWEITVGSYGSNGPVDNPWKAVKLGFDTMWEEYLQGGYGVSTKVNW